MALYFEKIDEGHIDLTHYIEPGETSPKGGVVFCEDVERYMPGPEFTWENDMRGTSIKLITGGNV